MTNPTNPFNWQMPTASDLVTDLPADFETFGQAVATSMADLLGGTTGQVLSKASNTDMDFTWVAQDDSNAIQNAIVDAKGDLIAASAADTPARLAVGNNGETLVADSSTSTGLRYNPTQAAGRNYLINGAMDFWQRSTSYALPATAFSFGAADRWGVYNNSVTGRTISRQTAGLAGFTYSQRLQRDSGVTTTQNTQLVQVMESSVSTSLQGQYVTVSFWAKAGANYSVASSNITVVLYAGTGTDQNPYTTGYTGQTTPISTSQAITTSWAKYSFTTSAVLASTITELTLSIQSGTFVGTAGANDWFEITGVQLEAGQTGTLFTRAGGTIQGELAACQRYYYRFSSEGKPYAVFNIGGYFELSTKYLGRHLHPVAMRTNPTTLDYANLSVIDTSGTFYAVSAAAIDTNTNTTNGVMINFTVAGATPTRFGSVLINNNTGAFFGIGAEL